MQGCTLRTHYGPLSSYTTTHNAQRTTNEFRLQWINWCTVVEKYIFNAVFDSTFNVGCWPTHLDSWCVLERASTQPYSARAETLLTFKNVLVCYRGCCVTLELALKSVRVGDHAESAENILEYQDKPHILQKHFDGVIKDISRFFQKGRPDSPTLFESVKLSLATTIVQFCKSSKAKVLKQILLQTNFLWLSKTPGGHYSPYDGPLSLPLDQSDFNHNHRIQQCAHAVNEHEV
jgi:hypothetical protein